MEAGLYAAVSLLLGRDCWGPYPLLMAAALLVKLLMLLAAEAVVVAAQTAVFYCYWSEQCSQEHPCC